MARKGDIGKIVGEGKGTESGTWRVKFKKGFTERCWPKELSPYPTRAPKYMKLKKKDIRGKYKIKIDLRKLKGSSPLDYKVFPYFKKPAKPKKDELHELYRQHLKNKVEHIWVETLKCAICGKYHEAYLYEMNPKQYKGLQKQINKLIDDTKK